MQDDSALLTLAARLAWQAAEAILAWRARGCATEAKQDHTPITEADRHAERLIVEGLRHATPHIEVIAEEEIAAGHTPRANPLAWLVDPLDGTRDFVAHRDEFTVNIGLVREGRPVLGVVAVPATATLFGGIVGQGAWKQTHAGRHPIQARACPATGPIILTARHDHPHAARSPLLAGITPASLHPPHLHALGSALKFCRLADGSADLYPRLSRSMEWDTAGPEAILTAAGGTLRLPDGTALPYGKPGWANPPFLCRGRA